MLGRDVGPLVLRVVNPQLLVDEGLPRVDRICGGCGGSRHYGRLVEVVRPTKARPVGDQERFRCDPCRRRADKHRTFREEVVRRIDVADPVIPDDEEDGLGPDAA